MLFLWLVILQLVLFGVLVLFLRVFMTRNVTSATAHLHALNQDYAEKIEEARHKHAEADKYYDETILKAKKEAEMTKTQLVKEGQETRDAAINDSRKQGAEILEQAKRAADAMRADVDAESDRRAIDKACELLYEVIPDSVGRALHVHWTDELLKSGLEDLGRLNVPADLATAEVAAAYALTPDQKKGLAVKIREKMGKELFITETLEPDLLVGFRIRLANVEVDGSLKNRIRERVKDAQHTT